MCPAQLHRFLGRFAGEQAVEESGRVAVTATDAIKHPLKMLPILMRGVKTDGPMAPEIDLSKQRPAEFMFAAHVEQKMSAIKAGKSNTTEVAAAE